MIHYKHSQNSDIFIFIVIVYYKKQYRQNEQRERTLGKSPEKTRHKFLGVPPSEVAQNELNSSSNDVWQQVQSVANQGSSTEPGFLNYWGQSQSRSLTVPM